MRKKITQFTSTMEAVINLSCNNPGAVTVMMELIKENEDLSTHRMLMLDDMNLAGSSLWIAYKDYCKQDINKLIGKIKERNGEMVDYINSHPGRDKSIGDVVTRGHSFA